MKQLPAREPRGGAPTGRHSRLQLGLRLGVGAVCVAAPVLTVLLHGHPEMHPVRAMLQYLPFHAYLGPALAAVLASLWLGWRWRLAALAALLCVLFGVMGLNWGRPDEGEGRVRVMTYNAKYYHARERPNGLAKLYEEVLQQDPDVLVMQDAGGFDDLQETQPGFFKAFMGGRQGFFKGQYVVASRWPMRDCKRVRLAAKGFERDMVHCVITVHGQDVDVLTVHFTSPRSGLNAVRSEQLEGLDEWTANMNARLQESQAMSNYLVQLPRRPRIVAGDLNAPEPSTVVQQLLATGLRDAFSAAGTGFGFTHGHSLRWMPSFLRIDHILVSEGIGVAQVAVGGSEGSEHRPVVADLLLQRQSAP